MSAPWSGLRLRGGPKRPAARCLGLMLATLAAAFPSLLPGPTPVSAQTPAEALRAVSPENAALHVAPLARALTHAAASGVLTASDAPAALRARLGVAVIFAVVPEAERRFLPYLPSSVAFAGVDHADPFEPGAETPTAAGVGAGAVLRPRAGGSFEAAILDAGGSPEEYALELPRGFDLSAPWTPHLELTLGLVLGTDVVARLSPTVAWTDSMGDVSAFGVTLRHRLERHLGLAGSRWSGRLTAGLYRARVGGYLATHTSTVGLAVGAALGTTEVYAHGRLEKTRGTVSYDALNPVGNPALPAHGTAVRAEILSATDARLGLGLRLRLKRVALGLEVTPGDFRTVTARVALAER